MIRELENVARKYDGKPVFTGEVNIPMMCREVQKRLKELSEQPQSDKWISCKVDLPKKKDKNSKYGRGEYNGTVVNKEGHVFTTSVIFDYVNKKWVEEHIGWKVIAWCELPEPYMKEGVSNGDS